jgi:hypothetical protein
MIATTWDEIDNKLSHFLDDVVTEGDLKFSVPLRVQSWNWAQDIFVAHTALQKQVLLAIDNDTRSGILPEDFYIPSMLYDENNGQFLQMARFKHGTLRDSMASNDDWWCWGNRIFIEKSVDFTHRVTLYYFAYYPKVTYILEGGAYIYRDKSIYVPRWAEEAIVHLTCSAILMPGSISAAMQRNYNIMIDSGSPIQNSRMQQSFDHFKWYHDIIRMFPPQDRGSITQL